MSRDNLPLFIYFISQKAQYKRYHGRIHRGTASLR